MGRSSRSGSSSSSGDWSSDDSSEEGDSEFLILVISVCCCFFCLLVGLVVIGYNYNSQDGTCLLAPVSKTPSNPPNQPVAKKINTQLDKNSLPRAFLTAPPEISKKADLGIMKALRASVAPTFKTTKGGVKEAEKKRYEMLNTHTKWDWDVFKFTEVCYGQPLLFLSYKLFHHHKLFKKCNIPEYKFVKFITAVEFGYNLKKNPYHGAVHATDVTQAVASLLHSSRLITKLSCWDRVAMFIAAIIHDYGHPGVNNDFLLKTNHPLGKQWKTSVIENFSIEGAFELMDREEYDIFANAGKQRQDSVANMIEDLVLATDIAQQKKLMGSMKKGKTLLSKLQLIIKCADISNPARPHSIYMPWVDRVMEEFWSQGDQERMRGLPISQKHFDRDNTNLPACQTGFINFVVLPLYEVLFSKFPKTDKIIRPCLDGNLKHWSKVEPEKADSEGSSCCGSKR